MRVRSIGVALLSAVALVLLYGAVVSQDRTASPEINILQDQLRATETAFAKTMADRDADAFANFIADEAVFFGRKELRGRNAVVDGWSAFFKEKEAPFSWTPEIAIVLDSGSLGLTSGPVFDPKGKRIGTFNSTWRRENDGEWKVVFDKGCPPCDAK